MTRLHPLLLLFVLLVGCGDGALRTHAQIATAADTANTAGAELLELTCRSRALTAAGNREVTHAEAEINANAVLARCEQARQAQHVFSDAINLYVDQLVLEVAGEGEPGFTDRAWSLAANLIPLWADLVDLVAEFGVDWPALPSILTSLRGPE